MALGELAVSSKPDTGGHSEGVVKNKLLAAALGICAGLFPLSAQLFAHHGNASFDYSKKVTVSGVVTDWLWANPHSILNFDAKDEKGEIVHWTVEAGGPPDMARQGWTRNSFKAGDQVTVTLIQAKNGRPIGRFVGNDNIILNGKPFPPNDSAGIASDGSAAAKP